MINVVIFSKDRPAQLELLLRSMKRFFVEWNMVHTHILYKYTNDDYRIGYEKIKLYHPEFDYVLEQPGKFKEQTVSLIRAENQATMFMVDDMVFKNYLALKTIPIKKLLSEDSIACVAIRMCPRINYCYTERKSTPPPKFTEDLMWFWNDPSLGGDIHYPMSIDGSIFRTEDIYPLVRDLPYENPNTMEGILANNPINKPYMICYRDSLVFNIPVNKVQTVNGNHCGSIPAEYLNKEFLSGKRISMANIEFFENTSCHQEIPLILGEDIDVSAEITERLDGCLKKDYSKVVEYGVSIVICTYNDSHFMLKALKSCLLQKVPKEIIVVDDCSTVPLCDEVVKFIEKHNVRVIRHDKNMGLSAARNTGISSAKYDLVIPIDADDYFFQNGIDGLVLGVDDIHDIFYGDMVSLGKICVPNKALMSKNLLLGSNPIFCTSLFRKKVWEKAGGYKVIPGPHYEDWNFWCKAFISGSKFKYVDSLVYEHIERGDSMLRTLAKDKDRYVAIATQELKEMKDQEKSELAISAPTPTHIQKLHLGCGSVHIKGFINVDITCGPYIDAVDDVRFLEKFENNSAPVIYACHVLEHFGHEEVPRILRRWKEVLMPGGEIRISVPDIDRIVEIYKNNWSHFQTPGNSPWIGLLYGGQGNQYDVHKTGFNFCWLKYLMEKEGYKDIEEYPHTPHWLGIVDASLAEAPFGVYLSLNVKAKK